jgi:hypothetical protein
MLRNVLNANIILSFCHCKNIQFPFVLVLLRKISIFTVCNLLSPPKGKWKNFVLKTFPFKIPSFLHGLSKVKYDFQ